MSNESFSASMHLEPQKRPAGKSSIIQLNLFRKALRSLQFGSLSLTWPDGEKTCHEGKQDGVHAEMTILQWHVIDRLITHGDVGLGEDYMAGKWSTPNLLALMRLVTVNIVVFDRALRSSVGLRLWHWFKHRLFSNTVKRSRENVHEHYDLGNDFYQLWLDKSMTYSCALFGGNESLSLYEAQQAKYERILQRLAPERGSRILEIGCGWGGFMEGATAHGCHVTGATLSSEQADCARQRLRSAGLEGNTEVRLQDYRELSGPFDFVVSIGMFEHVGETYWPTYMKDVHDYLRPGGKALIQTITIAEERFERYRSGNDFLRAPTNLIIPPHQYLDNNVLEIGTDATTG